MGLHQPSLTTSAPSDLIWSAGDLLAAIDTRLDALLPGAGRDSVSTAMRAAVLGQGKRVRPLLTILTARRFGHDSPDLLDVACTVEMIHAASLVIDDLPCMDNAALRRGRPTLHRAVGQSTAILAAVALLARAFEIVATLSSINANRRADLAAILTRAVGVDGLVGGQASDLTTQAVSAEPAAVDAAHGGKTGALFVAAVACGACLAEVGLPERRTMEAFAASLGLAFQARDDVLDATASAAVVGKDVGQDRGRCSLVEVGGLEGAVEAYADHLRVALAALDAVPRRNDPLRIVVARLLDAKI